MTTYGDVLITFLAISAGYFLARLGYLFWKDRRFWIQVWKNRGR